MQNPFGPQSDPGSYVDLRKRLLQSVQSAKINDQIIEIIKKALETEHVVLSRPERKRLFSQIVNLVSEDLIKKLEDDSISVWGYDFSIVMTAIKSLLFLIVAPGMVAGYIPLALLRRGLQLETGIFAYLAFPLWAMGGIILLWAFWNFIIQGRGTPAPIDPPKQLVATGFYRYVRNPMYVGVLAIIIGHFLWFGYWNLLIYVIVVFIAFNTFVTYYEEPTLKRKFGAAYEEYLRRVPRWIPRLR
jgi:protein-S-isoprenylcysteine O-methyltransferase Ste14